MEPVIPRQEEEPLDKLGTSSGPESIEGSGAPRPGHELAGERIRTALVAEALDTFGIGVFVIDRHFRLLLWNRWLEDHSGVARGVVLGKALFDIFPEIRERGLDKRFADVLSTGTHAILSPHFHLYLLKFPAQPEHAAVFGEMRQHAEIHPLRMGGRIVGAIVTLADATPYLRAEINLRETNEQLRQTNARLEEEVRKKVQELTRKGRLERFFSPRFVDAILKSETDPTLGTARKKLSILSCDLRGIAEATEGMEPEEITHLLSDLLREMAEIIYAHDGTLDRFTGEGIRVFFGDPIPQPNHAERSVRVAWAMQRRVAELNGMWQMTGHRRLSVGIGINSGYVTVGPIGSETHLQYTAIGRHAALAGRLRDFAKGGEILVTHFTYGLVRNWVEAEELGSKNIQGFQEPVYLYRIVRLLESAPPAS